MRAVLTYHSIDPSGSVVSVDETTFQRHVDILAAGRVRVVPLDDLLAVSDDDDAVALTFDDGFQNFAEAAWPRLREAGLPATVFVVTEHVGGDNRWGGEDDPGIPTLPLMDWETLGALAEEGLDLGSHTRTHRHLPELCDAELEDELAASRDHIERETGSPPRTLAYPFGHQDARVADAARAHYRSAWTTELGLLRGGGDALLQPRLDAYYLRDPRRLESYGTRAFGAYVSGRAFARGVRSRLRRVLGGTGA